MARRGGGHPEDDEGQAGFVVIDGLVALTLVAVLLALTLNTVVIAQRASRSADARRWAAAEAQYRLAAEWPGLGRAGNLSGVASGGPGTWRLSAAPAPGFDPASPQLCRVSASVVGGIPARPYALSTIAFCGAGASAR